MSMLAACGGGGGGGGAGGGGGTPLEVSDISLTTDEDTALEITFEASGTNAATAMFVVATQPTNGQISCSGTNNSTCTYTPRLNFFGSDSFTYQADDGTNSTTAATVSITVSPLNDPPAGVPQTITTNEDNAVGFFLAAADVDGDSLTYTITSTPTHGILGCDAINTEQCTYTPSPDYNGSDSFTYTATDSSGETNATSAEVTVNLTVASVNDAPLASSQNASGNEDQALNITLSASDSDGTIATYTVVTQPNSGTLSCTGASCTYTGKTNFSGADTFTFKATDDSGADSNVAVVSISLTQANDAPVAHDMNLTLNEDSTVSFSLSGSDIEGDTLTAFTTTYAGAGSLSCSGALCTYTPAADASGADSFTFTVSDGTATSAPATVTLTIQAVNDAPVASGQNVAADEENTVSLTLSASDSDGTISTYTVVAQPNNGTLSCTGASCTYTGNTNFVGTDTFSFKATDNGGADSNVATVTVNVSQINDAPVAHDQTLGTNDGNPVSFTLYGSDVDGDTIVSYTVDTSSTTGSVSCTGASCTYTPGGSGADSFTFTVSDGTATSAPATVSINVASVGTGPTASNQNVSTGEDTPGSFTLSATDPDSGSLTYTVLANPSNGSVSCDPATGDCTYTPAANYNGADAFTWKANDGSQDSNVGTVSLTVSAANDAPVAHPASYTINQNGSVSFALTGSDIDGDTLTAFNTSYSGSGTLNCTGANCTYTPGGSGPDSFTFTVSDGTATSASATVNLTVVTANLAPSANSQTVAANEEAGTAITLTASDSDGSIATYTVVTQPYSGVLDCSGASCTYTGNTNFVGSDRFTFKATDNSGADSNLATVTVNVSNVNDDPVAIGANYSLNEDNTITFTLTGYDVDGDTLTAFTPNYVGAGSLDCTGADCTYTMGGDNNGVESFTFTVSDGSATSAPATVNMTVVAVNDMPMAYDNVVSLDEDTTINFSVFGYDRESTLTFILPGTTHSGGTLACTGQSCDYTPPADFYGSDYFTFYVNDGSVDSPQATVVINVSPINDDPSAVDVAATTMEDNSTTLSLY
ncbi:MAG: Ig-like domain-containing protein, partial [Deltaproteobacteria bacterium]|nr:Ig-like domain-containing protein [Deltaproteobacteria bacterium]